VDLRCSKATFLTFLQRIPADEEISCKKYTSQLNLNLMEKLHLLPNHNEIVAEIISISAAPAMSWPRVGALLDRVEREEYWRNESSSFTEWVKSFSVKLGLKEGSVWRMLTVSRFYIKFQAGMSSRGHTAPMLIDLNESVSAEKLELFEKISRVADRDITVPLFDRVIHDSITRTEIRLIWEAYRPVLAGRTARGRGADVPHFDRVDPSQFVSLQEAQVMLDLQACSPKWTGISHPNLCRFFSNIRLDVNFGEYKQIELDIVVIVRETPTSPLVFHGIDIRDSFSLSSKWPEIEKFLSIARTFCDFLWIATNRNVFHSICDDIGLLKVSNKTVEVQPATNRRPDTGIRTGDLAKALLLKIIKK
jgi:hypothetical protein